MCDLSILVSIEAKKRQATSTGGTSPQLTQKIAEGATGESRQQVAEKFNTNRQYVSDVKNIRHNRPDLYKQMESGDKTIQQAKREIKEDSREEAGRYAIKLYVTRF